MASDASASPQTEQNVVANTTPPPPGTKMEIIPGLEPLIPVSHIFMKQRKDTLEAGTAQARHFVFYSVNGQMLYGGDEDTTSNNSHGRSFKLIVCDRNGNGITLDRQSGCSRGRMDVFAISTGEVLGKIEQQFTCCMGAIFNVLDEGGNVVFILKAEHCTKACCRKANAKFHLVTVEDKKSPIGQISKSTEESGLEMYTDAENFGISFPEKLPVKMKAVLLGAIVLIDSMFYKNKKYPSRKILIFATIEIAY